MEMFTNKPPRLKALAKNKEHKTHSQGRRRFVCSLLQSQRAKENKYCTEKPLILVPTFCSVTSDCGANEVRGPFLRLKVCVA